MRNHRLTVDFVSSLDINPALVKQETNKFILFKYSYFPLDM